MRYRNRNSSSHTPRNIVAKYAGKCFSCGGAIAVGAYCEYIPATRQIGHVGAVNGNSTACYAELKRKQTDPGYVDVDRLYEDQCADICGR